MNNKNLEILDENRYIEMISKVIQRDFFPTLTDMKLQKAYLDAVEQNDKRQIEAVYNQLCFRKEELLLEDNEKLGLEQVLNLYTSEDNASFADLQQKISRRERIAYKWAENPSANGQKQLPGSASSSAYTSESKNLLMFHPESSETNDRRSATLSNWSRTAFDDPVINPIANAELPSIAPSNPKLVVEQFIRKKSAAEGEIDTFNEKINLNVYDFVPMEKVGFKINPMPKSDEIGRALADAKKREKSHYQRPTVKKKATAKLLRSSVGIDLRSSYSAKSSSGRTRSSKSSFYSESSEPLISSTLDDISKKFQN